MMSFIINHSEEAEENCEEHDKDCHDEYHKKAKECAERCEAVAVPVMRKETNCEDKCDAAAKENGRELDIRLNTMYSLDKYNLDQSGSG